MKWISVKDRKPTENCNVIVTNEKVSYTTFQAIYQSDIDCFIWYDPTVRESPPIEVTHWLQLPPTPWTLKG